MLQRAIGKHSLTLMLVNSIIGAGIFGLPSRLYALVGVYSLYAFGVCAAIVFVLALCFAEVSSRFSHTGGPYLYVQAAFGNDAGFGAGWLLYLGRIFNYATLINLVPIYLLSLNGNFFAGWIKTASVFIITIGLLLINLRGAKETARVSNWLTVAKLVPLFALMLTGVFFIDETRYSTTSHFEMAPFAQAVMLLIFAFGGFESVLINSGEVKSPGENLPGALLWAMALVAILYVGIQGVCIGMLPDLASEKAPLSAAAFMMTGSTGEFIIASGAVVSIIGTLNVLLFSASRLPFALAMNKQMPAIMGRVNCMTKVPETALYASAFIVLIVSLSWGFLGALTIAVAIRLIIYLAVCLAMLRLRGKKDHATTFRLKYGYMAGIAGLLCCAVLLTTLQMDDWIGVGLILLAGYAMLTLLQMKSAGKRE